MIQEKRTKERGQPWWITHDGKTQRLIDWARELGTSRQRLSYLLYCCNGDLGEVLKRNFSERWEAPYTAFGRTDTLENWAAAVGFSTTALRRKRKMLWMQTGDPVKAFEATLKHFWNLRS